MTTEQTLSRFPIRAGLAAAAVLILLTTPGCFTYVDAEPARVAPGEELRVLLHPQAARRLSQEWEREFPYLEGRIVEVTPDTVAVSVPAASREHRGTPFEQARQVVVVPRAEVLEFQERRLSGTRTALLAGGIGVGLALVVTQLFDVTGSGTGNGNGNGPPAPVLFPR